VDDKKIYLKNPEVLEELRNSLRVLQSSVSETVGLAQQKLNGAISFLEVRREFWENEFHYWKSRLYDREGREDSYARSKMEKAYEKISIVMFRLDRSQSFTDDLHRQSEIVNNELSRCSMQGEAFLTSKREKAHLFESIHIEKTTFEGMNNSSVTTFESKVTLSPSQTESSSESSKVANLVQESIN
jgi:hypothetical protein